MPDNPQSQDAILASRELFKRFKVTKFLGKGSYGSVYRVKRFQDEKTYALKEADVQSMNQLERIDSVNEVRLMASLRHPNVIRYHEAFLDGNWLCIIMEYAANGDLGSYIKKGKELGKAFPEDIIWKFFIQVLAGVQALHAYRVLHRDIKPMNIFVCEGEIVKVGDLGIAKILKDGAARTQIGTPHYMPPEIWMGKSYAYSCDLWSLGCLLYELMTYKVPFEAKSMNELRAKVLAGRFPPIPAGKYSSELVSLMQALLSMQPSKRPSVETILESAPVQKRLHLIPAVGGRSSEDGGSNLLKTIVVPKDLRLLRDRLPEANYDDNPTASYNLAVGQLQAKPPAPESGKKG